jgi:hypothetical protein
VKNQALLPSGAGWPWHRAAAPAGGGWVGRRQRARSRSAAPRLGRRHGLGRMAARHAEAGSHRWHFRVQRQPGCGGLPAHHRLAAGPTAFRSRRARGGGLSPAGGSPGADPARRLHGCAGSGRPLAAPAAPGCECAGGHHLDPAPDASGLDRRSRLPADRGGHRRTGLPGASLRRRVDRFAHAAAPAAGGERRGAARHAALRAGDLSPATPMGVRQPRCRGTRCCCCRRLVCRRNRLAGAGAPA